MTSIFAREHDKRFTRYATEIAVTDRIAGGTPISPNTIRTWIQTRTGLCNADLLNDMVAKTLAELGLLEPTDLDIDNAITAVAKDYKLNAFKRDERGLYLEGRCLKSCIKEASNSIWAGRRWGPTNKGTISFWAEHVFIVENAVPLGVAEASGIQERFVPSRFGTGISREEYVVAPTLAFTVETDQPTILTRSVFGEMWTQAEQLGLGSSRSQGYGQFDVIKFDCINAASKVKAVSATP